MRVVSKAHRRAAAGLQYATIVGLIGVIVIVGITSTGGTIQRLFVKVDNKIGDVVNGTIGAAPVPTVPGLSLPGGVLTVTAISGGSSPGACTNLAVSNPGTGTTTGLTLGGFTGANPGNFQSCTAATSPCGTSLAAGASCNFGIQLTATNNGTFTATATVSANGGLSVSQDLSGSAAGFGIFSFTSHTFSTCGSAGINGPTLSACQTAYSGQSWASNTANFNITTQGYQLWTVPETATYRITAVGAVGGAATNYSYYQGRGASMRGDFNLTQGTVLKIVVGQSGGNAALAGGGGGGSFVATTANVALIVAGGGGGATQNYDGRSTISDADTATSGHKGGGNTPYGGGGGANGAGGANSYHPSYPQVAAGGGGFTGNGLNGYSGSVGGLAFTTGATGGSGGCSPTNAGTGGFGGGASAEWCICGAAGGGGGYSGGGGDGGNCVGTGGYGGGGGGSYNNGTNQSNSTGLGTGHGSVTITKL